MRKNNQIQIDGASFNEEMIFCDICGWGDQMSYTDIVHNDRRFDFCMRHNEAAIRTYIEMNLASYSLEKGMPISNQNLKRKQIPMDL